MAGKIIGELIAEEVRRQKWNIEEFAGKICCTRQNVYDLFKRNSIDVVQLQLISKVLNHNFFADLARDPELAGANDPEIEKELKKRWAVAQFFDAMPRVLRNLHIDTNIVCPLCRMSRGILCRIMASRITPFSSLWENAYMTVSTKIISDALMCRQ